MKDVPISIMMGKPGTTWQPLKAEYTLQLWVLIADK